MQHLCLALLMNSIQFNHMNSLRPNFYKLKLSHVSRRPPATLPDGLRQQEEAHAADLLRPADLRPREDLRADQIPGGARAGETGLRPRDDRVTSQGRS